MPPTDKLKRRNQELLEQRKKQAGGLSETESVVSPKGVSSPLTSFLCDPVESFLLGSVHEPVLDSPLSETMPSSLSIPITPKGNATSVTTWSPTVTTPPIVAPANLNNVDIHRDDSRDQVLLAVVKTLLMIGNRPSTPKELAAFILTHQLATLGGKTPFATVSSRISQHFKRCLESNRKPMLGKYPVYESKNPGTGNPRKWRYYIDSPNVPMTPPILPPVPERVEKKEKKKTAGSSSSSQDESSLDGSVKPKQSSKRSGSGDKKKGKNSILSQDDLVSSVEKNHIDIETMVAAAHFHLLYPNSDAEKSFDPAEFVASTTFPSFSTRGRSASESSLISPLPLAPESTLIQDSPVAYSDTALRDARSGVLPLPPPPSLSQPEDSLNESHIQDHILRIPAPEPTTILATASHTSFDVS